MYVVPILDLIPEDRTVVNHLISCRSLTHQFVKSQAQVSSDDVCSYIGSYIKVFQV